MARVLGASRLSHDTDASTSMERQSEDITNRVKADRNTLVHIAEDTDVSGVISPFERPDLGPWLTEPALIARWDTLMVAKLDRLTRSVRDFGDLLEWCKQHKKNIVSLDGEVNTDTSTGWLHVQIIITFAEFERRRMSERRAESAYKIYNDGGFNGGAALPWGYQAIARASGGYELAPDPGKVKLATEIAEAVLGGESVASAAGRHGMHDTTLLRRLRSPELKGVVVLHGEVVRGADGLPKLREPIIPADLWARLQGRLDANSKGASIPKDATPWLDVICCGTCGEKLYYQRYRKRPVTSYYHKKGDCPMRFRGADVSSQIEPLVLRVLGDSYIPEVVDIPPEDHTGELARIDEAIADWEAKAVAGDSAVSVMRILDGLHAKRKTLADQPVTEARQEVVLSDDLLRDRWTSLASDHERGALLRSMGVRVLAWKDTNGAVRLRLQQGGRHWADVAREWTGADVELLEA